MNKLSQLLIKNQNLILFIFLQLIAVFWLFRTNKFHGASYFNATQIVAAHSASLSSKVTDYISLKEKNEVLANRLRELENENKRSYQLKYDSTDFIVFDTAEYKRKWKFYSAKIINKSNRLIDNYITIDRGEKGGVNRDMGVVNGKHVVGVIKKTSNEFAIVIPLINTKLKIGAKLKKSNHLGIVEWQKKDIYKTSLFNIPAFVDVNIGDTIITSGFSSYFPEGMLIGTVQEINEIEASNEVVLDLKLFTDFNSVSYVQVIDNILFEEQFLLENDME